MVIDLGSVSGGSKKWILNHYFFYSLIPSFGPEINFKKIKIPVTRPNVLDTFMWILVLIELTVLNWLPMELFSKTTKTFSKKTVFVASSTDITAFQRSQVWKSFLSQSKQVWQRFKQWFQIYSFQKIAHYSITELPMNHLFGRAVFWIFACNFFCPKDKNWLSASKAHEILYKNNLTVNLFNLFLGLSFYTWNSACLYILKHHTSALHTIIKIFHIVHKCYWFLICII